MGDDPKYSILLWFMFGTLTLFMAVGYPNQSFMDTLLFGGGAILFYSGGLYELFGSIEEQGKIERTKFTNALNIEDFLKNHEWLEKHK